MFCDVELSNFGGTFSNWLFVLELWENDKTLLHHCFSGQWWGRANTGECACGFCVCFWCGMPPGFGFVCQVILLKKLDYSAFKGKMHQQCIGTFLLFVCMYACIRKCAWFLWNIFFSWYILFIFIHFNVMMFFCLVILIVLYIFFKLVLFIFG